MRKYRTKLRTVLADTHAPDILVVHEDGSQEVMQRHVFNFVYEDADEAVNHPAHYTKGSVECWEVVKFMSYGLGNAVKYLWRYMDKRVPAQDLEKAVWYIEHSKQLPVPPVHPDVVEPLNRYLKDNEGSDDPAVSAIQALVMAEGYEAFDLALDFISSRIEELD